MPSYPSFALSRVLSSNVFERIRQILFEMGQQLGDKALVLTEARLPASAGVAHQPDYFVLILSQPFSSLLLATRRVDDSGDGLSEQGPSGQRVASALYQVELLFEPTAIAAFVTERLDYLLPTSPLRQRLELTIPLIQPNDATWQSQFTLGLVDVLAPVEPVTDSGDAPKSVQGLQYQVEQDRLINQVAAQIRQSLDLPVIFATAVQQVRRFLQADRLVIYQFNTPSVPSIASINGDPSRLPESAVGRITYESVEETVPCIIDLGDSTQCFMEQTSHRDKYRRGSVVAVDDVDAVYTDSELLDFLHKIQVRAKLVAPIVVQDELWGLLITHQCWQPRRWRDSEKEFLACIAEHLAIAIHQAQLNTQLHQQAQNLEQQVAERTQELYDALNAAQAASLAKTEFLAAMSHELRTPLTCIIGMSATLIRLLNTQMGDAAELLKRQRNYLKQIQDSGEHLLNLINDILELSQVEAGRAVLDVREFSLTQIAYETLQALRPAAEQQGVHLSIDLQIQASETASLEADRFLADPRRVQQILLNLLSNAIKFTPADGQVTLRVWVEPQAAVLQVEDTGIGIPDTQLPLLFKTFQQLDMSYHRQYEGTGLGLALTKHLVELHGGHIEVESTVNSGTTFTVWLPVQTRTTKSSGAIAESTVPATLGRIALVEHHEDIAMLICDLLTAARYQVVWIIDGATALRQIEVLKPSAILIESRLPDMNGYELLHHLRRNPITQAIKVLILSGDSDPMSGSHWLLEGADDWLANPTHQPEALLDKVAALMALARM